MLLTRHWIAVLFHIVQTESQSQFQVRTLEKGALIAQWCGNSLDAPSLEVGRNSSGKARHGRSNSGLLFVQHLWGPHGVKK